ncbi:MAG: FtsX-like permease family protein [Candidatus Zixiibacteriota bacterium]|nr:MAG: FtsX-like permease family protein [candidate division Zixibacteria bacterium]
MAPQDFIRVPGGNQVKYRNRKFTDATVFGTWPDYVRVRNREIAQGRFLSDVDQQFRLMNCVLGWEVASTLFGDESAVGHEVRVNGHKFTVVGVLEKVKVNFGNDQQNRVVAMPLSTFLKLYPWEKELMLLVSATSYKQIQTAKEEMTAALRRYRKVPFDKPDDFAIGTQDNLREIFGRITKIIYLIMLVITSVGLMVGGIGVMNIMLVSVTERTREIGVRKAIGARSINIILQFLTEATTLSATGGIIGILFGVVVGLLVNLKFGFPPSLSPLWISLGFFVAVSVGLVSGMYPAIKAARLDPIDSLRYE